MERNNAALQFFKKYKLGDAIFTGLLNAADAADKKFVHNVFYEKVTADDAFIKEIESALFSIERIIKNPQKFIAENDEVVRIEKAKKITQRSIRHLSINSNLIREVNDDGSVTPAKILSAFMEEDLLIHENRFVYTLILHLLKFLEMRRDYAQKNVGSFDSENLSLNANLEYGGAEIDYELTIKVKKPTENDKKPSKDTLLERINKVYTRVRALRGSAFFRTLSKTTPLNPPIAKTNLLIKNKDYAACYRLWLYLFSLTTIGASAEISKIDVQTDGSYFDDLMYTATLAIKVITDNMSGIDRVSAQSTSQKSYELFTDFEYTPDFKNDFTGTEDDYINEYYFKKIGEILRQQSDPLSRHLIMQGGKTALDGDAKTPDEGSYGAEQNDAEQGGIIPVRRIYNIAMPFTRFYRKLASINSALYREYLNYGIEQEPQPEDREALIKAIADKKELLRRHRLLCRLKEIELEETRRMSVNIEGSIELMEHELKLSQKTAKK